MRGFPFKQQFLELVDTLSHYPCYCHHSGNLYTFFGDAARKTDAGDIISALKIKKGMTPDSLVSVLEPDQKDYFIYMLNNKLTIRLLAYICNKLKQPCQLDAFEKLYFYSLIEFLYCLDELLQIEKGIQSRLRGEISKQQELFFNASRQLEEDAPIKGFYDELLAKINSKKNMEDLFSVAAEEGHLATADYRDIVSGAWTMMDWHFLIADGKSRPNDDDFEERVTHTDNLEKRRNKRVSIIIQPDIQQPSDDIGKKTNTRSQKNRHHIKIARYIAWGVFIVAGLTLLTLATIVTLGLVHLAWVAPALFFSVGGGLTGGSTAGIISDFLNRGQRPVEATAQAESAATASSDQPQEIEETELMLPPAARPPSRPQLRPLSPQPRSASPSLFAAASREEPIADFEPTTTAQQALTNTV